ncbi:GGDEF domain-containing protein [Pseudoblastomonas halimionae]|uniref:diguanylate cyclase n=1 Tax=Alteriqipengyuania halimionae TaxID=1926630 RepID=A0A6I4U1D9_9SPHN|nr:diguanylate cyclase [Alteriqipengyuania halimionae]MXP09708.1 diguanylate cyclase [Alteriqipengyuania halimionae]
MRGVWEEWVVEATVPKEVRGDYAIVAAEHVRSQEPLLYCGFLFGALNAILLAWDLPPLLRFWLPAAIMAISVVGLMLRRSAPATEARAIESLTISICVTCTIIALGAVWTISAWHHSAEAVRLTYPFFMAMGVLVTSYGFAKVRRLAALCLAVGLGPLAVVLIADGTGFEMICGAGIFVSGLFVVLMARNDRRFLVELLEHRQRLHRLSRIDSLTDLPNRRALLEDAERMGLRGETMRLVLIDIDHFKAINDRHGHDIGDYVLCAVADVISNFVRQGVCAARIGGEEFALLGEAKDLSALSGLHLVETLRNADMPHGDQLTVSAGVATGPLKTDGDWRKLYARADKALYEAKADGRDRVVAEVELAETPDDPKKTDRTQAA